MKRIFADTFYWIALANPKDEHHERARSLAIGLGTFETVTTDEVLSEFLNFFRAALRVEAAEMVRKICDDPNIRVLPQTRISFQNGLRKYRDRPDKTYSLIDCISMATMENEGISEVLTNDKHFEQEGMTPLFRNLTP
jgi:predicted nucleic acid-binding protein